MKQLIFAWVFFLLFSQSYTVHCMNAVLRGYDLTIKKVPNAADKLIIKINQWSPAPKKVCSCIVDFAAGTCQEEQNIYAPFDVAHKHFTNVSGSNSFIWDIPNFGLIQLQSDGTMCFGHDKNSRPLKEDYLKLSVPGKIFLENLHVFSLRTKSETYVRQALTTDRLWVDWGTNFYNHGYVKTNQLGNGGTFINKGIVEFEGTHAKPALLRIGKFHNDTHEQGESRPTVRATHLRVTTNNTLDNKKGALFEVSDEFIAEPYPPCYGVPSVFHNNGEFKASVVDLKRELVNNGFLQADRLTAEQLHNSESGRIEIFNQLLVDSLVDKGKITVVPQVPHYYLTVKKLPSAGKFAVQVSKAVYDNKQICSVIVDFAKGSYYKERNMGVSFNAGHTKGFDGKEVHNFLWNIPDLGLITLQQDGTVFFGHDPATAQLAQDGFSIRTPGKLFLDMLCVGRLHIKSSEAYIGNCVIADQVHADRTVYNHAVLQTKQLLGNGDFINQGRVEFEGSQEEPAKLGIKTFINDKHDPRDHKPQPNVTAEHLHITKNNERVRNEKGARFDVGKLIVEKTASDNGFLYNKGAIHARTIDVQRKFVSKGLVQADQLTSCQLLNQKSGRVKIFSRIVADDLTNEGEIVSKFMQVWQGTNRGTIAGSPDLTLRVGSDMKNYGNIRLCQLSGCGHILNRKTLLFNDNASITIKNITNDGLLKATSSLNLYNTELSNTISGIIELYGKSVISNATITNAGNLCIQDGDIDFKSTTLRNYNAMRFRSGGITCIDSKLHNKDKGNWLMENIKSVQPLEMDNEGVLEVIDSSIDFERMRNHKELLIRGGASTFKQLTNNGVVKTDLLHLVPNAHLRNLKGGSVQVFERSIIHHAKIINDGNIVMQGETNFTLGCIYNRNTMTIKQGAIDCAHTTLRNLATGKWLMERMKSVQPIRLVNDGIFELAESSLDFNKIQNNNDLVLHSGSYRINDFKNKTLQLVDTDWTITGDVALPANNKLVLTNPKIKDADLGHIQGQHKVTYDFAVLPSSLQVVGIDLSDRLCTLQQLQAVKTTGRVIARCDPEQLAHGKISFPSIGHLELTVTGPLAKDCYLKAPSLTLHVLGALTMNKSQVFSKKQKKMVEKFGTIAATHGPLTVRAESIDGRYGKFYGKGKTLLETNKGDIVIGAEARGVDEGIKQQFVQGVLSSDWKNYWGTTRYISGFDHSLSVRNGAYAASGDSLTLKAATKISVYYGELFGALGVDLIAPTEVTNHSGKISSYGPIAIESDLYNHTRLTYVVRENFPYDAYCYTEYPGSIAATLESLKKISFKTKKIYNRAGSMRSAEDIILNGSDVLTPATGYFEEPQHFYIRTRGYSYDRLVLTQSCIMQAGKTIQMNLGDFVVTGNMNAPGIFMFGRTGLFANSNLTRDTKNITQPIMVDVTRFMQEQAQQPGFYKVDAQGAVQTQFPFGVPSAPNVGDQVLLENPGYAAPLQWKTIFNPLSSINLDLHLQQLLSNFAGKVYAGRARGNATSRVLWANANRWRQQQGKEVMTQGELHNVTNSMLLAQIMHNGMTEQQKTLLCIAPQDINPYQDSGDIVADEFVCVTQGDQTHLNDRIIAQGPQGVTLRSQTGDVNLQTQAYTVQYYDGDGDMVTEQRACPQQQLIAQAGPVNVIAHQNITRVGTAIAAAAQVNENAQTGSVIKQPLVLQKTVEKTEVKDGLFSSKTTITTNVSHNILPSTTIAGTILHDRAGTAIHAVAPQDAAGQEIIYESPNTVIEGIIVADRKTTKTETSSMFTDQSTYQSQETPCMLPAAIQAPVVRLVGDAARINANITARELHDDTVQGAQFVALVKEMLYSQQTLVSSPFMSLDAGRKGGYEVMIQPMLMVDQIIRNRNVGHMLFESAIIDKTRTQIIGDFVETTYQLKKWEQSWCHKSQLIGDEGLVLVALAVAVVTQGMGVELLAGVLETVTAATGMQLTAAGVAMVNAGVTAICSAAATSFLRTGDPLQTVEHLVSDKFLKSLAVSMASAGLCSQLGDMLDINMASGIKPLVDHAQEQALRSTVDALLNVAINDMSVDQALGNACKQIPLNAVAAYVSNQICTSHLGNIGQKVAHTALGGATGFAVQGNKKGLASGAVGALTAQTVGDILTADAFTISDAAVADLKKTGKPLTQENIHKAIDKEIDYRMKIAKITAGTIAAFAKLDPSIAMQTAANVIDNDMAIRAKIYAMTEMQSLLTAATQAVAHLEIPVQAAPEPVAAKTTQKKRQPIKRTLPQDHQDDIARDILLYALENPVDTYDDLIMQCAQEWQPRNYAQQKQQRSLMDRIVNPEMTPLIKETSEVIRAAFDHAINETINTYAYVPNPVGLGCFAAEAGRDIYQKRTTVGEFAFNTALAYGALKGVQLTGRGIKYLYQKGRGLAQDVTDATLNRLHQKRYAAQGLVPFVQNPRAGQWSQAAISGDVLLDSGLFGVIYKQKKRSLLRIDQAAPFNVAGHGNPSIVEINTLNIHPKALSQANLKILKKEGKVALNEVQLARLIVTAPGYKKGQHINLFSCKCGAEANGIAQKLSTRMGVPVSAFTDVAAVNALKSSFSSYSVKTGKKGAIKTFYPEFTLSRLTPLALLPALLLTGSEHVDRNIKLFDIRNNFDNYYDNHEDSYPLDSPGVEDDSEHHELAHDANHAGQKPFVQNPERGIWIKGCISGDLMLEKGLGKLSTLLLKYNTLDRDEKCPFTVFAHGSSSSVLVEAQDIHPEGLSSWNEEALKRDGYVNVNAHELKRLIETAPGYKPGQHVHLFSCLGGSDQEGIAQQLADEMQVSVSAFTGYAGAPIIGGFFSSTEGKTLWSGLKEIKTFEPRSQQQQRIAQLESCFGIWD